MKLVLNKEELENLVLKALLESPNMKKRGIEAKSVRVTSCGEAIVTLKPLKETENRFPTYRVTVDHWESEGRDEFIVTDNPVEMFIRACPSNSWRSLNDIHAKEEAAKRLCFLVSLHRTSNMVNPNPEIYGWCNGEVLHHTVKPNGETGPHTNLTDILEEIIRLKKLSKEGPTFDA